MSSKILALPVLLAGLLVLAARPVASAPCNNTIPAGKKCHEQFGYSPYYDPGVFMSTCPTGPVPLFGCVYDSYYTDASRSDWTCEEAPLDARGYDCVILFGSWTYCIAQQKCKVNDNGVCVTDGPLTNIEKLTTISQKCNVK